MAETGGRKISAIALNLEPIIQLTDGPFYQLCQANSDIKLECNRKGELLIMPPTRGWTGDQNGKLTQRLFNRVLV